MNNFSPFVFKNHIMILKKRKLINTDKYPNINLSHGHCDDIIDFYGCTMIS
jgi:hypothetical protein